MLSALLMLGRAARAFRVAVHEQEFLAVLSVGVGLVLSGTLAYALGEGWNVLDALYFAVATLTTSSVADPDLELTSGWTKLFTVLYVVVGIGVVVEILRRFAVAAVIVHRREQEEKEQKEQEQGG